MSETTVMSIKNKHWKTSYDKTGMVSSSYFCIIFVFCIGHYYMRMYAYIRRHFYFCLSRTLLNVGHKYNTTWGGKFDLTKVKGD